jgi:hypothetical protein
LASTIHIWDFDSSKDTIVLVTSDGAINLNETRRTLFYSAYTKGQWNSEQVLLSQTGPKMTSLYAGMTNYFKTAGNFKAAEHVFTGEGMPVIVVDEQNYSTSNPDSIFNALKTSQRSNLNGQLPLSEAVSTTFGQLNTNAEHQQYTVHLNAGESYVFTMSHRPNAVGNGVLVTSLTLKDAQNTAVAIGKEEQHGNSRIDYLALKDGDFYLDASGSLPGLDVVGEASGICINPVSLSSWEGKYAISTAEIPHKALEIGSTALDKLDGIANHLGYKMCLSAGDYLMVSFLVDVGWADLSIRDALGNTIGHKMGSSQQMNQFFMAQKTGDYFIDATVAHNSEVSKDTPTKLFSISRDIEGSNSTMADLSINTLITSNLYDKNDHDWFKVSLDVNKKYQFDLRKVSFDSNLDTFLTLRDSKGKQLAFNDDYADPDEYSGNRDSQLIYTAKTSSDYYIDASSFGEQSKGAYTLSYKVI